MTIQFERFYEGTTHPFADRFPVMDWWHAKPTMLNLVFTHTGEWVKIPNKRDTKGGPNYFNYTVGKIERYIDKKGITRSAVAYGDEDMKLTVWFHMEDMVEGLVEWILPETPY